MMNICTIVCRNYLAQARVIAASFRAQYPDGECVVLVVDAAPGSVSGESFPVLTLADLDLPHWGTMAGIYEPIELSTAVKPWLLGWMLERYGEAGPVAYFDPDIAFYGQMPELEAMLAGHWIALTPHLTTPMPLDGHMPSEQALLLAGTYNLGFVALIDQPRSHEMLEWWKERLEWDCLVDPANGFFVDQRYVDFVPGLFDGVGILRHDGYNVAYWNLASREIAVRGDRSFTVNGLPLRFFHFSGFDPRLPDQISRHQTRVSLEPGSPLAALFASYADDLLDAGYADASAQTYGFGRSALGHSVTASVRSIYRVAVREGFAGSMFDPAGDRAFGDLLAAPDPGGGQLPRGLTLLWAASGDLQNRFPDVTASDREPFLAWCRRNDVGKRVLGGYVDVGSGSRAGLRRRPRGVNVVGYLNAESGVGEAARSAVAVLDHAELAVWPVSIAASGSRSTHPFRVPGGSTDLPFTETLLCVNADMVVAEAPSLVRAGLRDTRVTGLWWWETEELPGRFDEAFGWVDQVVCGSSFVADAVARRGAVPAASFPLPVQVHDIGALPPAITWPVGFVFYFAFDYASVFARKNPLGVVEAYRMAFDEHDGVHLVIKSVNGERFAEQQAEVVRATADRSDIKVIDGFVDAATRNAMTAAADCYVSLHRAEGFGLTIAEAMYLGRPVITTAYSGNMDFTNEDNALLVPYRLERIGSDAGPYDPNGRWAEPDVVAAAEAMRRIASDPSLARRIGQAAARSIRTTHSLETAARALRPILVGGDA